MPLLKITGGKVDKFSHQITAILLLIFLSTILLNAQQGLDITFADEGKFIFNVSGWEGGWEAVVQKDGKIVVAGWREQLISRRSDALLIRLNQDGSLDNTFNSGYFISFAPWSWEDFYAVALQEDDKIVAVGRFYNGSDWDFLLIRFNSDGHIDSTFGYRGYLVTDFSADDRAFSVDVQQNGKIIIAGYSLFDGFDFSILVLNPDGSRDSTFGNNGSVITDFVGKNDVIFSVKAQDDGKIIACGWSLQAEPDYYDFALVRYNSDGSLDPTFGVNGKVTTDVYEIYNSAHSIDIQEDGKYVVAGYTFRHDRFDYDLVVARYNIDGSLDNTFGIEGIVVTDIDFGGDFGSSVKILKNNKIAVAGFTQVNSKRKVLTLLYNADGTLDQDFGTKGYSIINIHGIDEEARGVAINENEIIITGVAYNGEDTDLFVIKYPSQASGIQTPVTIPFILKQNYPNPFNSGSTIEFFLMEAYHIKIKIFDILGSELMVLMDEIKMPGNYKIPISLEEYPSGIYFYQFTSHNFSEMRKMVYIK
jgi:uncharacterized delta-60 repeat protein